MKNTEAQRTRRAALAAKNASPKQRKERARRKAMGIALIERPLRLIAALSNTKDEKGNTVESREYKEARRAANYGSGGFVRGTARVALRG